MMQDKEFNLIDERWIRVLKPDGKTEEVSLQEVLLRAHEYLDLAGETPTQDVAVLRLLLAVLHTVFSRVDENGTPAPFADEDDALERWGILWQTGHLPEKPICDYLETWKERFWLFHPERPFYQVPGMEIGKYYVAKKWNGEILESGSNEKVQKASLFSPYSGKDKTEMSYKQAARWLLHMNGFDVTISGAPSDAVKKKYGKLQSAGAGYLGKLGLITAQGKNIFETLMLNLVLLKDGNTLWEQEDHPCWEADVPKSKPSNEISAPKNAAELLTLQSRRILLHHENNKVLGLYVLGGDFFSREKLENMFAEQMTVWRKTEDANKNSAPKQIPKQHDPSVQMWREFSSLVANTSQKDTHSPGVIQWIATLKTCGLYNEDWVRIKSTAMQYKQKDGVVTDCFCDALTFHADLLTKIGKPWQTKITDEIENCERAAREVGKLAKELELAAGGENKGAAEKARRQFYFAVDMPFRKWLQGIDPNANAAQGDKTIEEWRKQAKRLACRQAEEMVQKAGNGAFVGRTIKIKDKPRHYSSPEAFDNFLKGLNAIYKTT